MKQVLSLAGALTVVVFVGSTVRADKFNADKSDSTVAGTVSTIAAADLKITVTDKDGKDHALTVARDAKIQCDGKDCKLADLTKGTMVTVTLNPDHKDTADKIEAKTK
jgi:hypothetical protein